MSKIDTKCVTAGYEPADGGAGALPIYQSTTFKYNSVDTLGDLFDLKTSGHFYTRLSNPTNEAVENKINALEGGVGAMVTSAGQAASLIVVTNIASYGTPSVAQAVFAHILNISNQTALHAKSVRNGDWCKSADICYCLSSQTELANRTLGIIGFGAIGRKVAEIANGFDMKTIAFSPSRKSGEIIGKTQIKSIDEIFEQSDIISLNCPLNAQTEKIINSANIAKCKQGAWIINTGRGGLIDEYALADALKSDKIAFAGLDVLSTEPPTEDNPLLKLENCFITPHNAWTSSSARQRLINICFNNFKSWLDGETPVKNSIIL